MACPPDVDFWTEYGADDNPMRSLANELGMRFAGSPNDRTFRDLVPAGIPDEVPLLQRNAPETVTDLVHGDFGGLPALAFVLEAIGLPESPGTERLACVAFTLEGSFPLVTLGPHTRLSRIQERSTDPFEQRFRVMSHDTDAARVLLDASLRGWLLGLDVALRVELAGSTLLGGTPAVDIDGFRGLLATLYGFELLIPDEAWSRWGVSRATY